MELNAIKDAFDKVAKKNESLSTKSLEVIDHVGGEIEKALAKLNSFPDPISTVDHKSILIDLKTTLDTFDLQKQLDKSQKELNANLSKHQKSLEKSFNPDISKAYRNIEFDVHIVNQIIANHFYQKGLFELGDCLVTESGEPDAITLKSQFVEMHRILDATRAKNLDLALNWVRTNRNKLHQSGSDLELKLHKLKFVEFLQKGNREEALAYARMNLAPFASVQIDEIQKPMGCLLWVGRIEKSPYFELTDPTHLENIIEEFTRQFCNVLCQSYETPLSVAVQAGFEGLPTLLKLVNVMVLKKQEWKTMKQLPVPVDLGSDFQFHSIFVCPVSRDQASEENPPMLMPCGHVLCRQSIAKLSKGSTLTFKCPYCPIDASVAQCKQLYF